MGKSRHFPPLPPPDFFVGMRPLWGGYGRFAHKSRLRHASLMTGSSNQRSSASRMPGELSPPLRVPDLKDPFAVVPRPARFGKDKQSTVYSRPLIDQLAVSCATSRITQDGAPNVLARDAMVSTAYKPVDALTLQGTVHNSSSDPGLAPVTTSGAGGAAEAHLPLGSIVNLAATSDQTRSANPGLDVDTTAYDAQLQKPVGKLPLTLVLKGRDVETAAPGTGTTRLPSLEQSLVWKPADDTTLQAGPAPAAVSGSSPGNQPRAEPEALRRLVASPRP